MKQGSGIRFYYFHSTLCNGDNRIDRQKKPSVYCQTVFVYPTYLALNVRTVFFQSLHLYQQSRGRAKGAQKNFFCAPHSLPEVAAEDPPPFRRHSPVRLPYHFAVAAPFDGAPSLARRAYLLRGVPFAAGSFLVAGMLFIKPRMPPCCLLFSGGQASFCGGSSALLCGRLRADMAAPLLSLIPAVYGAREGLFLPEKRLGVRRHARAAARSDGRAHERGEVGRHRLGDDVRHAVDEVEAGEVEQRIVEQRFFRHDAHDADVAHFSEIFIRAQAGLDAAVRDLDEADVSGVAHGGVHRDDGAARVRFAQEVVHVLYLFGGDRLLERSVHEDPALLFAQESAADGPEAVSDGEVAADAEDDGRALRGEQLFEGEHEARRREFVEEVERIFHGSIPFAPLGRLRRREAA